MSALVTIKCPCSNCNQRIEYPPDMCGQQITCPHCQQVTMLLAPQISSDALETQLSVARLPVRHLAQKSSLIWNLWCRPT